jgi:4-amino-4-deoxy-L-arabinose transferase-like glycosyltransferase
VLVRQARWLTLGLAVVAGLATWIATRHGPGMSPDSVTYLSAARNLASGHGYTDFTGQALTNFPPGYPALVAVMNVLGTSLATAARIVNAVSFGAIVVLAGALVRRHTSSPLLALGATMLVAVSPALINIASNAWSETLYCAFVLAFLLALEAAIAPGRSARWLASAGALAGLAFLVRYVGLSLLMVGSLTVIAVTYREGVRAVAHRLAVFLAAGLVLPALWILHNARSGTRFILGPRVAAPESWSSFISQFFDGFRALFTSGGVGSTAALVLLVLGLGALVAHVARPGEPGRAQSRRSRVLPLVVYVGVYAAVVVTAGKTAGASVDQRIVSPIYVPALILGVVVLDVLIAQVATGGRRWVAVAPVLVALVAVTYVASAGASFASVAWNNGRTARGYTQRNSDQFQLVDSVEALNGRALVATNRPWTLFEATGRQPIVPSPGRAAPELSLTPIMVSQLATQSCDRPVYLAWFQYAAQWPFTPAQLSATLYLDPVQTLRDGTLYVVRPKVPDCPQLRAAKRHASRDVDASSMGAPRAPGAARDG